jgi:tetratricopeptide (TPR) repeat protein
MGILEPFILAYQSTLGPPFQPILLLFTLLSLRYVWRGIQLGNNMWRNRDVLVADPLTKQKAKIAEDASFYVFVPIGVFIHELGHAIVVWLFGGVVLEFGYFFYWGYVLPDRTFSDPQQWLLSIAGTLGNVVFLIAVYFFTRHNPSRWVRFLGRRVVRFQIFFAFIYYPIFTALLAFGDWRTIYAFGDTPMLSSLTAVCHAGVLILYVVLDRRGWFDTITYESAEEQRNAGIILGRAEAHPDDVSAQWGRMQVLMNGGNIKRALREAQTLVKRQPDSAEAQLMLAIAETGGQNDISPRSGQRAVKALSLGLSDPAQLATAHRMAASYYDETNRTDDALHELELAFDSAEIAQRNGKQVNVAPIFYEQGLILRRIGRKAEADDAFERAISQAKNDGYGQQAAYYQQQVAALSK